MDLSILSNAEIMELWAMTLEMINQAVDWLEVEEVPHIRDEYNGNIQNMAALHIEILNRGISPSKLIKRNKKR